MNRNEFFKEMIYGNNLRGQRIFVNSILVLLAFCVYGIWTDFIATEEWRRLAIILSCVITAIVTPIIYWGWLTGKIEMNTSITAWKKVLAAALFPLLLYFLVWIAMVSSVPDLITIVSGSNESISTVLDRKNNSRRRLCDHHVTGKALEGMLLSHICISPAQNSSMSDAVETTLIGKSSYFGFHISSVHYNLDNSANGL